MTVKLSQVVLTSIVFFLFGCNFEKQKNVVEICSEHPQMCRGFNTDAWCKSERSDIIRTRYSQLKNPSDKNRYSLLIQFENYRDCVHKASQIEHLKLKKKKNSRIEGYMMAKQALAQQAANTKNSHDPALTYYHWSRFQDEYALKRYLRFEKEKKLETPQLQVFLAEYYNKIDYQKTIQILLHALSLYNEGDTIDGTIFDSLSTLYMSNSDLKSAYIWAYLGQEYRDSNKNDLAKIDLKSLRQMLKKQGVSVAQLEDLADQYYSQVQQGVFKR